MRMQADKAELEFGPHQTLLGYVHASVGSGRPILIAGPDRDVTATYVREDPLGGGPVAAIAAALSHVETQTLAVIAVDTPFGSSWLLHQELDPAIDAVIPRDVTGKEHYLCALYRTSALRVAIKQLPAAANSSMKELISFLGEIAFIDSPTTEELTASEVLLDVNTPDDLELAHSVRTRLSARN